MLTVLGFQEAASEWSPVVDSAWFAEAFSASEAVSPPAAVMNEIDSEHDKPLKTPTQEILWGNESIEVVPNQWLVQLTPQATREAGSVNGVADLLKSDQFESQVVRGLGLEGLVMVQTEPGVEIEAIGNWLESRAEVAHFEPNEILTLDSTPNDSSYSNLWGLHNTGQTGGTPDADIDAPEAWDIVTGAQSIVVGVIDSGVDYNHPDLAANMWTNPGEIADNGIDDDGNGFIDDIHGYDFANSDGDPMDDHFHGTHVAGTIAGVGNNSQGVVGVNWSASIMALKFLDSEGSGYSVDAIRAINYATMMRTDYGVDVRLTNNSWGGGGYSQSLHDAIIASGDAGLLFLAAAGNSSTDNDTYPHYPSSYDSDYVVAVASTDHNDNLSSFSCYGATSVDLAAPGSSIYSTFPTYMTSEMIRWGFSPNYETIGGTSMATPHVAGVAALAWSLAPNATVEEVRAALFDSVDPIASLSGDMVTGGRLNAFQTLGQFGMNVATSDPAQDAVVSTGPLQFTVDFTHAYDPSTVGPSDLTVNGSAADSVSLIDSDTVTFQFVSSPVTVEGPQTMAIADGALLRDSDGSSVGAWQASFYYDTLPMVVDSTTPAEGVELAVAPAQIVLNFNEALDAGSIGVDDLLLSEGQVTAAVALDADSAAYTVTGLTQNGQVTYTLQDHAILDTHGAPSLEYVGHFTVDNLGPAVVSHSPSGNTVTPPTAVRFTFDESMAPGSFDVLDDIRFTGPAGDLASQITGHTWVDSQTLEVQFAEQAAPGAYTMVLGPNVTDDALVPHAMDQDGDGVGGETPDDQYSATFSVIGPTSFPFFEDWESGAFESYWEVVEDVEGRIQVTSANGPYDGSYHVTMDDSVDDSLYSLNQLILHVDLAGQSGVVLSFANQEWSDEDDLEDSVQVSVDGGVTWVDVVALTGTNSTETYTERAFNLDLLGLTYAADTRIRFQQFDNWGIGTDGMAFDNIRLGIDTFGPIVTDHTPSGNAASAQTAIRFTFDTPMDTASFDIGADVAAFTGPAGDLTSELTGFTWVDNQTLEVQFNSQAASGNYTMTIGPNITDAGAVPQLMNQDGDGSNGETPDDQYTATFGIVGAASFPFFEDWESGLASCWETIEDVEGRIQITSANGPFAGSQHLTMDDSVDLSLYSLNQLILHIDLAGQSGVELSFANIEWNDEDHLEDSVQISVDGGATWVDVVALTGTNSTETYTERAFNLDSLGLTYSSDTWIRFQQYDDHGIATDGMAFDNIRVGMDESGPAVTNHTPSGNTTSAQTAIRFTFDEAMDTATFNVLDDVVEFTGPAGDLASQITGFTWLDDRTLEVQFVEQAAVGVYTMVIGPNITDAALVPHAMDQDEDGVIGETPDDQYTATFNITNAIYAASMDTDPGWTFDAGAAPYQWEWGVPTGAEDPASGFTGANVVGYNLSGDYPDSMSLAQYATTSAIDCSGFINVTLGFYRWLGIESSSYDHASIEVSADGAAWTTVWNHSGSSIWETAWSYQEYDISAVADGQPTVYVRWGMGTTDSSVTYAGWNIDDVLIVGTPGSILPAVTQHTPSGSTADPQTAINFRFNKAMDTASFNVLDDVAAFTGPAGDLASQITGFTWLDSRTLEVQFNQQAAAGAYTMVIGPNITDNAVVPSLMDQDGDRAPGETPDDQYTAVFNIVGVIYAASMDSDPGWTFDAGTAPYQWEWGVPTGFGDPTSGFTGSTVVGYNLTGDYPNDMSFIQHATTPVIDCSGYEDVTLSFYRWLGVEDSIFDHANIEVSADGAAWTTVWDHSGQDLLETAWLYQEFDISAVADGQATVYIRWGMGTTDGSITYPGWNIDDVLITGTTAQIGLPAVTDHTPSGATTTAQTAVAFTFNKPMDSASFAVQDDVAAFTGPTGDLVSQITGFTWLDSQTLEVQFAEQAAPGAYTMVIGPNITDDAVVPNPMDQDGDGATGETPEDQYTATFEIIDVIYVADMDTDPGWTLDDQWQWGTPTGGGSHNLDPTSGYTGTSVIGYNLAGDYPNSMTSTQYATTAAIDCSGYENVTLSFYRWLGIESSSYDHANIEVSADGAAWATVWEHSGSAISDTAWSLREFDISAVADDQPSVYVRWGMGTTDGSVTYPGWNIDDVRITGAALYVPEPPTVVGVFFRGGAWRPAFLEELDAQGHGHATIPHLGFANPVGDGSQLDVMPWSSVNQISVVFDQETIVEADDLSVRGVNTLSYALDDAAFSYDPVTYTATWSLVTPLPADKLLLVLDSDPATGVRSLDDLALDGEWVNPTDKGSITGDTFPSGDGAAGGDFAFRADMHPGNVNGDDRVTFSDFFTIRARLGQSPGTSGYNVIHDLNGDARITFSDAFISRARLGVRLPAGEPGLPPAPLVDYSFAEPPHPRLHSPGLLAPRPQTRSVQQLWQENVDEVMTPEKTYPVRLHSSSVEVLHSRPHELDDLGSASDDSDRAIAAEIEDGRSPSWAALIDSVLGDD